MPEHEDTIARLLTPGTELLRRATFKIETPDGRLLGTASLISPDGLMLTCHHVVAGMPEVVVIPAESPTPERLQVEVDRNLLDKQLDLALLKTHWTKSAALPLYATEAVQKWYSFGFQDSQRGFPGGTPLEGDAALLPGGNEYAYVGGNGEKLCYHVAPSFLLSGYRVSPGSSGAALIDQDSDCVAGVIAAADPEGSGLFGRSIGIPLTNAREWPPLRDALTASEHDVPRFGEALNSAGAEAFARAQRRAAVEDLMSSDDPKRFRMRIGIERFLEAFLRSETLLMPVIGESGSGKTFVMIAMALRLRHALLLRGIAMDPDDRSIRPQIQRALEDDEGGTRGLSQWIHDRIPHPSPEALARAARASDKPLVLLLDDINSRDEARVSSDWIARTWLPETVEWLRNNRVKLVISCRTEAWRLLLPPALDRDVFHPPPTDRHEDNNYGLQVDPAGGLRVGDLADDELPGMLDAFGLDERAVDAVDTRHPFFLRLTVETGSGNASRLSLIERAIETRTKEVARLNAQHIVTVDDIARLVNKLAREMIATNREIIPHESAEKLGPRPLLKGLVSEGILESTRAGYRFRFDQYADAERSRFLVPPLDPALLAKGLPDLSRPGIRGALMFAVERMLGRVDDSNQDAYAKIAESDGPLALRIQLLLELARVHQDGYMGQWRLKDWALLDEPNYRRSFVSHAANPSEYDRAGVFWKALLRLADANPQTVRDALIARLDDERPIIGSHNHEATVATLAGGCLTVLQKPDLAGLCTALASSRAPMAVRVLELLAAEEPGPFLRWALREPHEDASREAPITSISHAQLISLIETASDHAEPEHRAAAAAALRRWMSEPDLAIRLSAAGALRKMDISDVEAFDALLSVFDEAQTLQLRRMVVDCLRPVPAAKARAVVKRLLGCLDIPVERWSLSYPGLQQSTLDALADAALMQSCYGEIVAFLESRAGITPEADRKIVRCALHALKAKESSAAAFVSLMGLVRRCFDDKERSSEEAIVEGAFGPSMLKTRVGAELRALLGTRPIHKSSIRLAFSLMESTLIPYSLRQLKPLSAQERISFASPLRAINPLAWDEAAIAEAYSDFDVPLAGALVEFWRSCNLPASDPASEILKAVDSGVSLDDAFSPTGKAAR